MSEEQLKATVATVLRDLNLRFHMVDVYDNDELTDDDYYVTVYHLFGSYSFLCSYKIQAEALRDVIQKHHRMVTGWFR